MKSENKKKDFYYDCDAFNILFTICGCSKDKDKDISKKQLYTFICNLNMQGVKEALKNHAEFAKETIKTSSKTKPLELAVREIESEKVQLQICSQLIKSGADVNEKGDEITALKGTVSRIPFENYNEKMDMLNRLLESGAKPDSDIVSFLLNNDNSNWGMQYYFTLQILKKLEKYDGKPCDVWEFILAFGDKKSFKTLESLGHQPTKEEIYDTYQNYGKEQYEQGVKVKEDEVRQYSYDANGNQTDVKNTKTGQTESYTYDAENRLSKVSVTDKDGKTAVIQQNRYNGDGQRIQKVEGSKTTNYYYQDGVVSYTTDGENSQTSQNLIGTDGNILATQRYGSDHTDYLLYHKDIQGSSTSLVKEDGSADATYQYTDFGETTINGDNKVENEVCYTGGIYDQSTGLYYLNARYYNPEDGRFVTEDTYRGETNEPDTQNLYVYCADNPVNYVDPSGHKKNDNYSGQFKKLRVCTDGKIYNEKEKNKHHPYHDKNHQNQTAYFGKKLAADQIPYIVIPPSKAKKYKLSLGVIINRRTHKYIFAVVAECGKEKRGMGEVSIFAAWKLKGIKVPGRTKDANDQQAIGNMDQKGSWSIKLFKNSAPNGKKEHAGWSTNPKHLRIQLINRGSKRYKAPRNKCLN